MKNENSQSSYQSGAAMQSGLNYRNILETNNAIQSIGDDTYWLCVTRTVQESKLFPVPSYMLMSYLMCFYRYPVLLRKIEERHSAEYIGDRARNSGGKFGNLPGWGLPTFYLLGREMLINFGLLSPEDGAEDVAYVMDFWRRFKLAQQREDAHLNAREFGQRVQLLPERRVQVFHADLHRCKEGDRLHRSAHTFLAAVSQYGFLVSCESRVTLNNSGPYRIAEDRELIVREFTDLGEGDYPWLDGIAAGIPYNNLTVTMEVKDCHFHLMDDWGSFESKPEFTSDKLVGIGLYKSDVLSEGFEPVGMSSPEELAKTFEHLSEKLKSATVELWKKMSTWTRDQMMDAGAIVYFSMIKDFAHIAGVYNFDDWMKIDVRAARFRAIFNDEFSRDFLGELVGLVDLPSQKLMDYAMMQHSNRSVRYLSLLPANAADAPTAGSISRVMDGVTTHAVKEDVYTTTAGKLPLARYNDEARVFEPAVAAPEFRRLSDSWINWNTGNPSVDRLYHLEQRSSRRLNGQGAGLSRDQVEALRDVNVVIPGQ